MSAGVAPIKNVKMSSTETATNVIVRHRKNCRRTLLPFPRIIAGITDDKTKIHAKACMKVIVFIRGRMKLPAAGHKIPKKLTKE